MLLQNFKSLVITLLVYNIALIVNALIVTYSCLLLHTCSWVLRNEAIFLMIRVLHILKYVCS